MAGRGIVGMGAVLAGASLLANAAAGAGVGEQRAAVDLVIRGGAREAVNACDMRRAATVTALGERVVAVARIRGVGRAQRRRVRVVLAVDRCARGSWTRASSRSLSLRRPRGRLSTTRAGDFRVRAQLLHAGRVVARSRPSYLRVVAPGAAGIVDQPVSFNVMNVNRSGVPCPTDGTAYTVRGHLVGPSSQLAGPEPKSATLYLHGLDLGEWFWRLGAVPGYDHALEMAQLGHVSVTVDRLGYDASDPASGMQSCIGGQADIAHQIVAQLRAGGYLVPGGTPLRFARVALAGHSLGGAITQVEAYSFKDVDAVAILSFADNAATPAAVSETLGWGPLCLRGGEQSERGAPGYAHFTRSRDDFRSNFLNNAPASVVAAATPLWDLNPCGELESLAQTIAIDNVRLREIGVPVLIVAGTDDRVFSADGVRQHRNQFSGSHDVTLHLLRNATHGLTLEPTAPAFRHLLSDWLRARGF